MQFACGANMLDVRQIQFTMNEPRSIALYHFCTYFDHGYLTRGLALYESLRRYCKRPFILWILCFDDETYANLSRLQLPGIRLISQQMFEEDDERLVQVKSERSRVEYYWTCTPSLPLYVLKHNPEVEIITYLDADLYFFNDPQPIYDEFADGSVLIIGHRYAPEHAHYAATSGIYNVGMMAFRRDGNGMDCLNWWRERCLEWCYARFEDGKFGDQKYLDDWPEQFAGVVELKHPGAGLAPWNLANYKFSYKREDIRVEGKPLVFFHFHRFKFVSTNLVEPLSSPYALSNSQVVAIFLLYAQALERAATLAQTSHQSEFLPTSSRRELRRGVLYNHLLLVKPAWLSKLLFQFTTWYSMNEALIVKGFAAHARGEWRAMRHSFLGAIFRNPSLLSKSSIVILLAKSFFRKK
jgi:hypothetical protein